MKNMLHVYNFKNILSNNNDIYIHKKKITTSHPQDSYLIPRMYSSKHAHKRG